MSDKDENDGEFDRIVARNADDIRRFILRRSLLRILMWLAALIGVLTATIAVGLASFGWRVTLLWLVAMVALSALYGWWTWRRRP